MDTEGVLASYPPIRCLVLHSLYDLKGFAVEVAILLKFFCEKALGKSLIELI